MRMTRLAHALEKFISGVLRLDRRRMVALKYTGDRVHPRVIYPSARIRALENATIGPAPPAR